MLRTSAGRPARRVATRRCDPAHQLGREDRRASKLAVAALRKAISHPDRLTANRQTLDLLRDGAKIVLRRGCEDGSAHRLTSGKDWREAVSAHPCLRRGKARSRTGTRPHRLRYTRRSAPGSTAAAAGNDASGKIHATSSDDCRADEFLCLIDRVWIGTCKKRNIVDAQAPAQT